MVKDARNNELKVGDIVSLEIPSTRVVGDVTAIRNGGVIVGGTRGSGQKMTTGNVTVLVAFSIPIDPNNPMIHNALKLHNEDAQESKPASSLLELPN